MNKLDLIELWDLFEETSGKNALDGNLSDVISSILEEKTLFCLDLICFFLDRYRTTGNLRAYSKKELLEVFTWKRSQLQILLNKIVKQEIITYHQRRYLLNLKHPMVGRLWNYFFTPEKIRKKLDDLEKNAILINENNVIREEIMFLQKEMSIGNYSTKLKEMKDEVYSILCDRIDHREALIDLWKKKNFFIINYKMND